MTKCGVQSAKVKWCKRFCFLLSDFNDRINIFEYPEFVVIRIRKEFRFTIKNFYFGVTKFKYNGNGFRQKLSLTAFRSYYEPRFY